MVGARRVGTTVAVGAIGKAVAVIQLRNELLLALNGVETQLNRVACCLQLDEPVLEEIFWKHGGRVDFPLKIPVSGFLLFLSPD